MSVSLAEIVAASRRGDTSFVAESAGYIVLGLADGALRSTRSSAPVIDGWTARLDGQGDLISGGTGRGVPETDIERSLRGLLAALLLAVRTPSPNLNRVAARLQPTGLAHLVVELEAALVPVNRKAARRSLARLCRETQRSIERGDLVVPPLLHAEAEAPVARDSDHAGPTGEPFTAGGSAAVTGMPPRIHSVLAPAPIDELDIEVVVDSGNAEEHPVSEVSGFDEFDASPLELSAAAPRVTALDFEDTPSPILAAATSPSSEESANVSAGAASSPDFSEPFELSAPAPLVRTLVASVEVSVPEVPSLDVVPPSTAPEDDETRDETPTRLWTRVAPLDVPGGAAEATTLTDWSVAAETEVTAAYDLPDSVADSAQPDSAQPAELLPAPEADTAGPSDFGSSPETLSALDLASVLDAAAADEAREPPPAPEPPPRFPRLSRRRPSDVAELLARHGGARKTDENELLEGLGRLAELERSIG